MYFLRVTVTQLQYYTRGHFQHCMQSRGRHYCLRSLSFPPTLIGSFAVVNELSNRHQTYVSPE